MSVERGTSKQNGNADTKQIETNAAADEGRLTYTALRGISRAEVGIETSWRLSVHVLDDARQSGCPLCRAMTSEQQSSGLI